METTFWTLDAVLDSFKFENNPQSGDSDYHLIVKDDFGNTMVAEIPLPECAQGSAWASQIADARATFDSQFTATGSFKSAHDTPVRITGIAMFDKLAHGSGHSPNGIEIHPVLSIVFNPGPGPTGPVASMPTPAAPAVSLGENLFQNGDFEKGDLTWTASPDVITNESQAHGGFWSAWLGGYGRRHTDTLGQVVELPANAAAAILSFWLRVETKETKDGAFDSLRVQITDENGPVLLTLHTFSNRGGA